MKPENEAQVSALKAELETLEKGRPHETNIDKAGQETYSSQKVDEDRKIEIENELRGLTSRDHKTIVTDQSIEETALRMFPDDEARRERYVRVVKSAFEAAGPVKTKKEKEANQEAAQLIGRQEDQISELADDEKIPPIRPFPKPRKSEGPVLPEKKERNLELREKTKELREAREAYVEAYHKYNTQRKDKVFLGKIRAKLGLLKPQEKGALPAELVEIKERYDKAKVDCGRVFFEAKRGKLERGVISEAEKAKLTEVLEASAKLYNTPVAEEDRKRIAEGKISDKELNYLLGRYRNTEHFDNFVIGERDRLAEAEAEFWPPKEKNMFVKSLEWYGRQNPVVRAAIGAGLLTLPIGAATGAAVGVSGLMIFGAKSFAYGLASLGAGFMGGWGFDALVKDQSQKNYNEAEKTLREKYRSGELDQLMTEEMVQAERQQRAKEHRKHMIARGLTMAAVSAGTAAALNWFRVWESVMGTGQEVIPNPAANTGTEAEKVATVAETQTTTQTVAKEVVEAKVNTSQVIETVVGGPAAPIGEQTLITIGKGENLWSVIKDNFAQLHPELSSGRLDIATDTVYQEILRSGKEGLKLIGVPGGNLNTIPDGTVLDLGRVVKNAVWERAVENAVNASAKTAAHVAENAAIINAKASNYSGPVTEKVVNYWLRDR